MFRKWMSTTIDKNRADIALLALRLIGGGFMLTHGWPKFQKVLAGDFGFADPLGIGPTLSLILTAGAEFIGALCIVLGLLTRVMSLPLMFAMLVAALIVHSGDPFGKQEFPLLYFVIYLALFLMGSGRFSLDAMLSKSDTA